MSKKSNECLGPCYPKGTNVLHPITLFYVTNRDSAFCTTRPYTDDKGIRKLTITCDAPTSDQEVVPDSMYTLPELGLNLRNFLMLYQIYSYEDSSIWYRAASSISEKSGELYWATVRRIFDATLTIYGAEKIPHMDDESGGVLRDILEKYWVPKWTKRFDMTREKIMKLFTNDNMRHVILSYYKAAKDRWLDVPSHMDLLKSACAKLLEEQKKD
jgi:hypothetical protein